MSASYQLIFGSDLIIGDPVDLATFVVFFDTTFLPYTSPESSQSFDCFNEIPHSPHMTLRFLKLVFSQEMQTFADISEADRTDVGRWEAAHKILFDEGVLKRMPPPASDTNTFKYQYECELTGMALTSKPIWYKVTEFKRGQCRAYRYFIRTDLLYHFRRTDEVVPQIFPFSQGAKPRGLRVPALCKTTLRYFLPRLRPLPLEDLIRIRAKVKDTREGFLMHMQKLSKGLDECARSKTSFPEVCGFAQNLVETDLIPDYREFRRQLGAVRAGNWNKVLDAAGRIAEIDVSPWTPMFWAQLLRALGMTAIATGEQQKERLSNRYQAFQFMSAIEDHLD